MKLLLLILIAYISQLTKANTRVYFKTFVSNRGFVFGKALNEISDENKLNVTFDYLHIDFVHSMRVNFLNLNEDGAVQGTQT